MAVLRATVASMYVADMKKGRVELDIKNSNVVFGRIRKFVIQIC